MKKKILALVLIVALVASLAIALTACDPDKGEHEFSPIAKEDIKFGLICLHDETSTYDKNFIDAATQAANEMGVQLVIKRNVPEKGNECYEAAADLVDEGCNVIFADSFGHEGNMIEAAKEFPNVRFAHATGTKAHTENLANYSNAFASIYEGRYLAGVAAGMKLAAMYGADNNKKIGYVGAYPYAEVVSGYTSFFLGVRSICPNVTMEVRYTNEWYHPVLERTAAENLIASGCVLISQHADSMGAPNACEAAGIPNVTYNISTADTCESTYLIGSKINWAPYFKYFIQCAIDGDAVAKDWCGTIANGAVEVIDFSTANAAAGTAEKLAEVKAALANGSLKVFDCANFTVGGEHLTSYIADVDDAGDYVKETEAIVAENGGYYFAESTKRSAPYFDVRIDGITEI